MAQLSLFSRLEVAAWRDRTKSRRYSPDMEEFRRDHARRRSWGLKRRHAAKLCRSQGCSWRCGAVGLHDPVVQLPPLIWDDEQTCSAPPASGGEAAAGSDQPPATADPASPAPPVDHELSAGRVHAAGPTDRTDPARAGAAHTTGTARDADGSEKPAIPVAAARRMMPTADRSTPTATRAPTVRPAPADPPPSADRATPAVRPTPGDPPPSAGRAAPAVRSAADGTTRPPGRRSPSKPSRIQRRRSYRRPKRAGDKPRATKCRSASPTETGRTGSLPHSGIPPPAGRWMNDPGVSHDCVELPLASQFSCAWFEDGATTAPVSVSH